MFPARPFAALFRRFLAFCLLCPVFAAAQSISLAGLRNVDPGVNSSSASFVAVQMDSAKDLYLLLDEGDGVRVVELNPSGTIVLASAHIGAAGDHGTGLVLDNSANVYVTGTASSGQLTTVGGGVLSFPSAQSSFVAGFSSGLATNFVTSTGGNLASATGIFVSGGSIYVTGTIQSNTLPVTSNAVIFSLPAGSTTTGFVESFNSSGTVLNLATYLGGPNGNTFPEAIVADASGNIVVTGSNTATGFPTVNAFQPELVGTSDLFLTKLSASAGIEWSTLLGSAGGTVAGTSLALAANGTIYVGVSATTLGLPITNSLMPLPSATSWGVIFNFASNGTAINLGTVLGDGGIRGLALDSTGNINATGLINNLGAWPLTNDVQHVGTAFLTRISSTGSLLYSTRLGGIAAYNSTTAAAQTAGNGIAVASDGTVAVAGTWSALTATSGWLSEQLDLPMVNAPNTALPGTLASAVSSSACQTASAACSVGYVAVLSPADTAEVSLAVDTVPNLSIRNVGGAAFTVSAISATGYTASSDCTTSGAIAPGGACNVVLTGNGPGTVTVTTSAGSASFPVTGAALSASQNVIALQPKEEIFAGFAAASTSQTVVASNVTAEPQILSVSGSALDVFSLQDGTCTGNTQENPAYVLPANSSCTLEAVFNDVSTEPSQDGAESGEVTVQISGEPVNSEAMYGYALDESHPGTDQTGLTVSTISMNFGTTYLGNPLSTRSVVIGNATSSAVTPAFVGTPASDPDFVVSDLCPVTLPAYASCVLEITYDATVTAVDSATLALPNGATLQLTGTTLEQPGAGGLTVNPSIAVTPSSLAFGAVGVGDTTVSQSVTISNSSSVAIAITLGISSGFVQTNNCNGSVPASGDCIVQIEYAPTSLGVVHGQLSVTPSGSSPVDVALTAGGTNTLNFGSIAVGAQTTQWISLGSFEGDVTATVQGPYEAAVVNGYDYTAPPAIQFTSSSTGACTSNCYVGVRAAASSAGTQSGTLTLSEEGETALTYPLTAAAVSQSAVQLSGYNFSFGTVPVGSGSAAQFVSVVNPGNTSVTIFSVAASTGFTLTNGCGATLAGGASCVLTLVFTPTSIGTTTGSLTVVAGGFTLVAQLAGNGASNPASLSFSPASLVFASPSGAVSQTITVSNTGSTTVTFTGGSSAPSPFTLTSTCGELQPSGSSGSTCTLQFSATSIAAGEDTTSSTSFPVTSNGVTSTYTVEVSIVPSELGLGSTSLQVTPATLEFPTQALGQASNAESLTITNNASTTQTVNVTASAQFSADNTLCATLAAGASCTVPVRFLPFSAGAISGTIQVQGTGAILKVAASGIGLATSQVAAPAYPPLVQPITLSSNPDGDGTTQLLQITNAGSQPLMISGISASNLIVGNTCTGSIASAASCSVTLQTTYDTGCGNGCNSYNKNLPITILSNAASSPDIYTVSQTQSGEDGASTLPGFELTAASLTFPQEAIGSSTTESFQVESIGEANLTLAFTTTGDFTESDNCSGGLIGYQSGGTYPYCTVTVKFSPTASGFRAGTLQVATNAGLQTVTLGGNGPTPSGPVATTTTLSSSATTVAQGQTVTLTARVTPVSGSGTPTGTVTFSSGSFKLATETLQSGSCSYTGSTSSLAPGNYPVTATYSGDANNNPSTSSSLTITVTAALDATHTALTANPTTVVLGKSVTLTATVARTSATGTPGGTVQFYSGSSLLGSSTVQSGSAVLAVSTTGMAIGNYSVVANYVGDSSDQPSSSSPVTITVTAGQAATQTVVTTSPASVTEGGSVTLKAVVSETSGSATPTGSVSFYSGTLYIGTSKLSAGVAQFTASSAGITPGTYTVTGVYSGDSSNAASTSTGASVVVKSPTSVMLTANPSSVTPGQSVTLTATVARTSGSGTPTGSVQFTTGSTVIATTSLVSGVATYSAPTGGIGAGTYGIVANYLGDSTDGASSSSSVPVTVQ